MRITKLFNYFTLIGLVVLMSNTGLYSQKKSKKNSVSFDKVLHESVEYREIGPFRGGRSSAVVGVPGNPNLFYFGATGGGIWKTENGGETYENISDGFFGGSIGAIAIAKAATGILTRKPTLIPKDTRNWRHNRSISIHKTQVAFLWLLIPDGLS